MIRIDDAVLQHKIECHAESPTVTAAMKELLALRRENAELRAKLTHVAYYLSDFGAKP